MTALNNARQRAYETWKYKAFTLASGNKGWRGGRAALVLGTSKVVPLTAANSNLCGLLAIGHFAETVDATAADASVTVDLEEEIQVEWFDNATSTDAVSATTDIGKLAYAMDDQTATITPGRSIAGRIWAVDTLKGVAVQKLQHVRTLLPMPALPVYAANDSAPAAVEHDALYDVPATGAASTITLPAAAPDGTRVYFAADGTKNAHTVQYRDATGPTNLTTALTASKRHLIVAEKLGGKWFANAYVSP